jgi:beta-N-acetylhexosaminidase
MDAQSQIGQLFFVGFDGTADSPSLRAYLEELRPGGVILFARNIVDAEQVRSLNAFLFERLDPKPMIAVDQEGGRVSRLRGVLPPLPAAVALADRTDEAIRDYSRSLGRALAALGFNTDFAPVVDLSTPGAVNGIGDRSFGEDAGEVVRCARAFCRGLEDAGVASFLKHFPGLGATDLDSHIGLPRCARSAAELWERDLRPFRECADDAAGVMVAHVHCPTFDPGEPVAASLSKAVIAGLLRARIGFEGLSVTDDLDMGAVTGPPPEDLARLSFLAGNDMIMFCNSESKALAASRAMLDDLREGRMESQRLERSLERIARAKRRFGIGAGEPARGPDSWRAALSELSAYSAS